MKIILNNGNELNAICIIRDSKTMSGVNRDGITIVFNEFTDLNSFSKMFDSKNCESITIIDKDGKSYIHRGYTICGSIEKSKKIICSVEQTVLTVALYKQTPSEKILNELEVQVQNIALILCGIYESDSDCDYTENVASLYKYLIDKKLKNINDIPQGILPKVIQMIKINPS